MRETFRLGGHALYDRLVARPLAPFYDRLAQGMGPFCRAIDIGCGPGPLSRSLARHHPGGSVLGVDMDPRQVRRARRHAQRAQGTVGPPGVGYHVCDAARLPFGDGSVDLVVASESFHHWRRPQEAVDEVRRILMPGGRFIILEGDGAMTDAEIRSWGSRGLASIGPFVRWIFRTHGYTRTGLEKDVMPLLRAFDVHVGRVDGWWMVVATVPGSGA